MANGAKKGEGSIIGMREGERKVKGGVRKVRMIESGGKWGGGERERWRSRKILGKERGD